MIYFIDHPELGRIRTLVTRGCRGIRLSVRSDGTVRATSNPIFSSSDVLRLIDRNLPALLAASMARKETEAAPDTADENAIVMKARELLPVRCAELSQKTGLAFRRVSVRRSRTRWGSCSSNGNISLSAFLIRLPQELVDFVILHELCHTVHMNHSAEFHSLLDSLCQGREAELSAKMRRHRIS